MSRCRSPLGMMMSTFWGSRLFYDQIKKVHLELTSRCNAACPQCIRNYFGGPPREGLIETELSLHDVKAIFPSEFIRRLDLFMVNGNYGDGAVARECREVFAYVKTCHPQVYTLLITNGSIRHPDWWAGLAQVVDQVNWGLDGLADTHSLYRKHTNFKKIIENLKAFNAAGGKSKWVFNVFRHNEHQVSQASQLARELGCVGFQVRRSARFETPQGTLERFPVVNQDLELERYLEQPQAGKYKNPALAEQGVARDPTPNEIRARERSYDRGAGLDFAHLDRVHSGTRIHCLAQAEKMVYVSATGHVFPCCWIAQDVPRDTHHSIQMRRLIAESPLSLDSLDAKKQSILEIVNGEIFKKIQKSWSACRPSEGMLVSCAKSCGEASSYQRQ